MTDPGFAAFATVSEVKRHLALTVTTDDALLAQLVLSASAWIEQYCSRRFMSQDYSERRDGPGGDTLMLANRPVTAVASVLYGQPGQAPSTLVVNTDYYFTESGLVFLNSRPRGRGVLLVSYTAGYTTLPWDIRQNCIELTAWRYKERARIGERSKSVGGQEVISYLTNAAPASVMQSLAQWTNPVPL